MHVLPGRLGRVVTTIAAAALGASVLVGSSTASAAELDGPHYQQPSIGQCRNYTMDAALKESNNSPVVACSSPHTARVLATPMLPSGMTWNASVDSLDRAMEKTCYPALVKALGRTAKIQHRTAYSIMWFIPTATQRQHGARWMRCDVVLLGGRQLRPIPNAKPLLPSSGLPDKVARCLTGTNHLKTVCVKTHNYRATGATIVDRDAYPGDSTMSSIAKKRCPSLVSTRSFYATWASRNG